MATDRIRKRHSNRRFSWGSFLKKSGYIVLFILVAFSLTKLATAKIFPVSNVKIYGVQHIDRDETQALISPMVESGFFAVKVDRIKEKIAQLPWVSKVMVRRIWPNQVIITIQEKTPIARWNDTNLLSAAGELFTPPMASFPADLPQFLGPLGEQIHMAEYYTQLNNLLEPLHLRVAKLELGPTEAWSITLDNGIKLNLGRKDILTRISHFVKVYPKIVGDKVANVEYIDLRYANGVAVRWKSVT